jgi:protein-S-isoprenylcysteine O-methyltransferase Ste14
VKRVLKLAEATAGTAVFGASDGLMSILGPVMFIASRSPALVFPVAVMGAVSASYSMGAGEFLGQEQADWPAVPVMAAATFAGTVLPALPYLWSSGWAALAQSAAACLLVSLAVGRLRAWRRHRYAETVLVIAVGVVLTVGCTLIMPGGSA